MNFCPPKVTFNGVPELCPSNVEATAFTELVLDGNLVIPDQKPSMSEVAKYTYRIELKDVQVVEVDLPDGSTGYKIIVAGAILLAIQYVADSPQQKVHVVHYQIPFVAMILQDCPPFLFPSPPDDFVAHVCVEKIRVTKVNKRTFNKEIVLLVWIEPK